MIRKLRRLFAIALTFAAIPLACSARANDLLEDVVEKTCGLAPSGTFALRATDGTVQIYGTDSDKVKIVAIKKAFSPARLNGIQIEIEATKDGISINTIAPPKARWGFSDRSGTVDYIVNVPQRARIASVDLPNGELVIDGMRGSAITASLGSGRLTTRNCYCDQQIQVKSGVIDIIFDWLEERPVAIEADLDEGNGRALLPPDASFVLNAVAGHGRVASDFSETANRRQGGVSEIHETIGEQPLSSLRMRTGDGNIQISAVIW